MILFKKCHFYHKGFLNVGENKNISHRMTHNNVTYFFFKYRYNVYFTDKQMGCCSGLEQKEDKQLPMINYFQHYLFLSTNRRFINPSAFLMIF